MKRLSPDAQYKKKLYLTNEPLFRLLLDALKEVGERYGDDELTDVEVWCEAMKRAMDWKEVLHPELLIDDLEARLMERYSRFDGVERSEEDARRSTFLVMSAMLRMFIEAQYFDTMKPYAVHVCVLGEVVKRHVLFEAFFEKIRSKDLKIRHGYLTWGIGLEAVADADPEPAPEARPRMEKNRQSAVPARSSEEEKTDGYLMGMIDKGDWKNGWDAEKVKEAMLRLFADEDAEKVRKTLREGRGDRLRITWQNLMGFFASRGMLSGSSPSLNKMFFGDSDQYSNIDKCRKEENMPKKFRFEVLPLLEKYFPES